MNTSKLEHAIFKRLAPIVGNIAADWIADKIERVIRLINR